MNALVPSGTMAIVPQTFDDAVRLAKAMSQIPELPEHCKNVGTCLMIVDQAMRWRMSPFAVAQCSSNIKGKMMYEGKLMAAAVESMGAIKGHFDYTFTGEGENRTVTVTATRTGEDKPREIKIRLGDVQTNNEQWKKQPDQQLVYSGSRNWARRWTPAALLGAYAPEEFSPEASKPVEEVVSTPMIDGVVETKVEEPKPDAPKPEPSLRDQYNRDVPLNDPPKTIKITGPEQFLDWFQDAARACADGAEFAKYLEDADVVRMRKGPRNAHRARLEGIIAEGTARFGLQAAKPAEPPVDDGWPGPDPEQMRREREAAAVA